MNAHLLSDAHGCARSPSCSTPGTTPRRGCSHSRTITRSRQRRSRESALRRVTLGYYELERRDYKRIDIDEQVEVLTLAGNITLTADGRNVHAHLVIGRADASANGGHLLAAHVRPTLEVIVTETPAHLRRREDPETGLALITVADRPGRNMW
jgi:uncharacterized protein